MVMTKFLSDSQEISWPRYFRHRLAKAVGNFAPSALYYLSDKYNRKGGNIRRRGEAIDITRNDRIIRISRDNALYAPDILYGFDYFFNSVEPICIRVEGAYFHLVDFSTPRIHNLIGFKDFPILFPSLAEPFKTTQQYLDFAQLKPGQVVIDLGAYSGLTSIAFAKEVGSAGRVIAVEPDPLTLTACKVNLARSGHAHITLAEMAVTSSAGRIRLSSEGALGSAFASLVGSHRGKVVEVDAITLDGLMRNCQVDRVDFIKMDIEGAEAWVLPQSVEVLKRCRPKLIIEPHLICGVSTAPALQSLLESIGYHCELIEQYGFRTLPLLAATA
jgi:FkbM family methyltransferase